MSLLNEQFAFTHDVSKLFHFIWANGFEFSIGEVMRPQEMQDIYVRTGRSKTEKSQHLKKLAIDLNIFKDGVLATVDQIKPIGKYWESLAEVNRWGGSWRGLVEAGKSTFIDSPHFERFV